MKKTGWVLCLIGLLTSCGSHKKDEFVVEGTINNLNGVPFYAVYEAGNTLEIDTLQSMDGYFALHNTSKELIPIQFYYANKTPFTKVYVQNGDRIELSGDCNTPFALEVKGSSLNNDLFEFYQTHQTTLQTWLIERNKSQSGVKSEQYQEIYPKLQEAIIDYVNQYPDNPVSAILISDYLLAEADEALCDTLIASLSDEILKTSVATPIKQYQQLREEFSANSILPSFRWVTPTDTIDYLDTGTAQVTLLYFQTSKNLETTQHYQSFLKEWEREYPSSSLQIIEISLDTDSATWRKGMKNNPVKWQRRWLQDGYLASGVKALNIKSLPYLIVADSARRILSRGVSPDSLDSYIKQIIHPDSLQSANR